ncbi:MAG: hypothetical protein IPP08_01555 [Chlorobiota bacterium]|nr:MAG: hypothetical protein IPP08_01555 [Chlorobiota bacterium]
MKLYLISILLFLFPIISFSQAWTKPSGEIYAKLFYGSVTAKEQYGFDGTQKPMADNVTENAFFDRSFYLYSEGGLNDEVTIFGSLPYKRVITRDASFKYSTFAFGSLMLGGRYKLNNLVGISGWSDVLSANLAFTLPTGYTRNFTPSVGAGQIDAELSLNYGKSFHPLPIYAQAGLGFKYRSSIYALSKSIPCQDGVDKNCFNDLKPEYGNEITFALNGGYFINDWLLFTLQANGVMSVVKPTEGFSVANPIPTKQRYIKLGGGLRVNTYDKLGVSFDAAIIPSGMNIFKGIEVTLGIDYTFKL